MAHRVLWLRLFVVFAALMALGALATHGPAQGVGEGEQIEGDVRLNAAWLKYNQQYFPLSRGDKKADKKEMVAVAQAVTQYNIFRLTFHTIKADQKKMTQLVQDIERDITNYVIPSKNPEFQRIYAEELVKCLRRVLALDVFNPGNQPPVYNACALLPTLAKVKTPEVEAFFVKLGDGKVVVEGKDKEVHDSVRLSGMKGMAELPPVHVYSILDAAKNNPALIEQKKRDLDRVNALLN